MTRAIEPIPPTRGAACPATVELEAIFAGEPCNPAVMGHIEQCEPCTRYLRELGEGAAAFLAVRPPAAFMARIEGRTARPALPRWSRFLTAGLMVGAMAAGLVIALRPPTDVPGIQLKGSTFRVFFRRGGNEPRQASRDERLRPGDQLRMSYQATESGYLAVLDVDGTGKATALYPFGGEHSAAVRASTRAEVLPGGAVLDDAPGPEWLIAVWSREPMAIPPLLRELEGQRPVDAVTLSCDCRIEALRVHKEEVP